MSIPITTTTTPSQGGTSFETTTPTPSTTTPLFGPNLTQDSTGSAVTTATPTLDQIIQIPGGQTIVLTDAPITISQFSEAVGLSINSSKQTISQGNLATLFANGKIGLTQGDLAKALAQIRAQITALQVQQSALLTLQNQQIDTVDTAINNLNTAVAGMSAEDQTQINAMNTAIQQYNAGQITAAQFNTAADAYNSYVASRNTTLQPLLSAYDSAVTTFQQQVAANNALIQTLNPTLSLYDIPTIPTETDNVPDPPSTTILNPQANAPLTIPVPSIAYPQPIPTVAEIGPPTLNPIDYLTNYYQPIAQAILTSLALTNRVANLHTAYSDYLLFYLPGQNIADPPSYITKIPQVLTSNSGYGTGGVGIASLSPVFDSSHINGALANAIAVSDDKSFQRKFALPPLNNLLLYGIQVSTFGGLQASTSAMRLLTLSTLTNSRAKTAFGIAFALSNSQITAQAVSSGKIQDFVRQTVTDQLGKDASQNAIQNATEFLTAALNLSLLQSTLQTSAQALGTPGLVGQVLGNVTSAPPEALTPTPPTFAQAAQDTLNQLFLKTTLAQQLVQSQTVTNEAQAQQIASDSINQTLLQGQTQNAVSFSNALAQQLIASGIATSIASSLSTLGSRLLEEEANAQRILNQDLLDRSKVQDALATQLSQQAQLEQHNAQSIASKAVNDAFQNNLISNAFELQYALQNQLLAQGVKQEDITQSLTNVIGSLNRPVNTNTPALLNSQLTTVQSPVELANNLQGFVQGQLSNSGVDSDKARQIADQAVAALVGSNVAGQSPSILSLINKNAETIQRLGGPDGINLVAQSFRDYLSPSIDLMAFSRQITDPASNLFLSASTGVMYSGRHTPSNFKNELSIRV